MNAYQYRKSLAFSKINCHLYNYCSNNPVRYVDPDGNEIKITFYHHNSNIFRYTGIYIWDNESDCFRNRFGIQKKGVTFIDEMTECIKYLKKSPIAKNMIDELSNKENKSVIIKYVSLAAETRTDGENILIRFDTSLLLNLKDGTGSKNSTALILAHEFVHAFDHIIGGIYEQELNNTDVDPKYKNKAEYRAVEITNIFAKQLGEAVREDYITPRTENRGSLSVVDFINNQ